MNLDYMEDLDTAHPLNALARKMLNNLYNSRATSGKSRELLNWWRNFMPMRSFISVTGAASSLREVLCS